MILKIKMTDPKATLPYRGTPYSAGLDLCACLEQPHTLMPGEIAVIPTGIAMEIPCGQVGLVFARSGLGIKHGVALANGVGVIDSDYRGEIKIGLINQGASPYTIAHGERIAQLAVMPVSFPDIELVKELSSTQRGEGGFGSTGKK